LGGKKPNAFSISAFHSVQTNGYPKDDPDRAGIYISGVNVGLGSRLKKPDNYFMLYNSIGYQRYELNNYSGIFSFGNGVSNSVFWQGSISRNSIDKTLYPTSGSEIMLSLRATPPFSLMNNKDYSNMEDKEKFKWNEYHKWNFNFSWYTGLGSNSVAQKLVLHTRAKFGFLGYYNPDIGDQPFERFYLGGDGLSGYSLDGRDLIGMRGYTNNSLTPRDQEGGYLGGTVYTKYTLELRYPVSLNPMATIYVMGFLEAGNAQLHLKDFNPYKVYRTAGLGARIYLPMFGLLGLDWGYGFDDIPGFPDSNGSQFHFSINGSID
jgi:outer membrane protein insertion porin family